MKEAIWDSNVFLPDRADLEAVVEIDESDYEGYVRRIEQIDRIIAPPIESLVDIVSDGLDVDAELADGAPMKRALYVPPSIFEDREEEEETSLNTALCCSTLQRVWLHRRRFPKLGKKLGSLEAALRRGQQADGLDVLELLAQPFLPAAPHHTSLKDLVAIVGNPDTGPADPYTASQVFWVLLNSGERNAHTAPGFCAFFSIMWALRRRFPNPGGVAAGASPPTSYVTAKCLAPLFSLRAICRRRADLLDEIQLLVSELRDLMRNRDEVRRRHWLPLKLDELSGKLHELSTIAISREGFRDCAEEIGEIADRLSSRTPTLEPWAEVVECLVRALRQLGKVGNQGLAEGRRVVWKLLPTLVEALQENDFTKRRNKFKKLGVALSPPRPFTQENRKDFAASARAALEICQSAFDALAGASRRCSRLAAVSSTKLLAQPQRLRKTLNILLGPKGIFSGLARANREVESKIATGMSEALQWCNHVLRREIAHASAKNLTDFDPAELLSALFVTVGGGLVGSSLQVTDAVHKALVGVREDGSWVPGQPFFVRGDLGIWAPTSDIVWMLSSIIARNPQVNAADDALCAYVNWLERTRKTLVYQGKKPIIARGWISERNLRATRIDIWATTFAINALLGIRELVEYRLWELCEKRFTVLEPTLRLSKIDAVDLGALHATRLHRRLSRMARQAAGDDFEDAENDWEKSSEPVRRRLGRQRCCATSWGRQRSARPTIGRGRRSTRFAGRLPHSSNSLRTNPPAMPTGSRGRDS